jgi:N-acetylglutamate synthase-like GNAT family acetyltransferase
MNIRSASYKDIDQLLNLMSELGYRSEKDSIIESLTKYKRSDDYEVLVVEDEGKVLGCISLHVMKLFHLAGNAGRITSLVVSSENRGKGIGKALVNAADQYFKSMDCVKTEVTSGGHRKEAHIFYQSEGFVLDERRFIKKYQ